MQKSESIKELAAALCKFQADVSNPKNTARNPMFNSKYAPLEVVITTVKPIMARHGLSFLQSTSTEGENVIITTLLMHESGEWIESDPLTLPAYQSRKGGGKEFTAQGAGSAITYGRRYSLSAMLGISSEDDDDADHASHQRNQQQQNQQRNQPQQRPQQQRQQQGPPPQQGNPHQGQPQGPPPNQGLQMTRGEWDALRAKYIQGKGDDVGFQGWLDSMIDQGYNYQSIMEALNRRIQNMNQNQGQAQTQGA